MAFKAFTQNRNAMNRLLAITCLLGFFSSSVAAALPEELRVCWEDSEKPPYLTLKDPKRPEGIAVDLVDGILARQKIKAIHIVLPWKRCLADVESGLVDLVPNASFSEDRTKYAFFSNALYTTHMVLFYSRLKYPSPPKISSEKDMKAYRLGGILGFNYAYFKEPLQIDTGAKSRIALLRKLEAGRIDLAIEQLEIVQLIMRREKMDPDRFGFIPDPVLPAKTFHILVSKRHPQAAAIKTMLDEKINEMLQDGTTQKITARYLNN